MLKIDKNELEGHVLGVAGSSPSFLVKAMLFLTEKGYHGMRLQAGGPLDR